MSIVPTMWSVIRTTTTTRAPEPVVATSTVEQDLGAVIAKVHAEAGSAEARGNPAAFDAWQHALQVLRDARAAIERARKADGEG